jgi:hypothetical protein
MKTKAERQEGDIETMIAAAPGTEGDIQVKRVSEFMSLLNCLRIHLLKVLCIGPLSTYTWSERGGYWSIVYVSMK